MTRCLGPSCTLGALAAALAWLGGCAAAQPGPSKAARLFSRIPAPTAGGTEFWTDQYFLHDWRIQRRAGTAECRLLDGYELQHESGTYDVCLARLEQIQREENLQPKQGKAVILLHGLAAPRWSMHRLGKHLHEQGGYEIVNMQYASTRLSVDEHAQSLAHVIASLPAFEEINLLGHSMGCIVVRRYLAGEPASENGGWQPDPRIRRIVMIAPPNHGASTAVRLADGSVFKTLFGKPGLQLGKEWDDLQTRLATPRCEFGIIAGGKGNGKGYSSKLAGDDDGRLEITTTRLAGARDFAVVPALHELIGNSSTVFDYTLRFLDEGCFISPEKMQPIYEEGAQVPEPAEGETRPVSWWKR